MNGEEQLLARLLVDRLMEQHPLPEGADHACPYLKGRTARSEGFQVNTIEPSIYAAFMDRGFRRSGRVIYRPACPGCKACTPIRIPVRSFSQSRSMRRVWRRNLDLRVEIGPPEPTDDKLDIYARYLEHQHDGTMTGSRDEFHEFLYDSAVDSLEFRYLLGRRIIGVSLADRCPRLLSSVYMYFDPDYRRRSLGTYSLLWEIRYAADTGLDYYYLGYYVAGCPKMSYKADFKPHELLQPDGTWAPQGQATQEKSA
ncbi:MAG: arginyltransferase [Phycisphaerales bacterium]|nr:MAG: arginyltransferase [Phycisphaerales bacterium]